MARDQYKKSSQKREKKKERSNVLVESTPRTNHSDSLSHHLFYERAHWLEQLSDRSRRHQADASTAEDQQDHHSRSS